MNLQTPELMHRDLTSRALSLRADSVDVDSRSFEAVVATERPVQVFDFRTFEIIDETLVARGGNFPDQVPLLPNHRRFDVLDVIGSARNFRRENDTWVGRGFVANSANDSDDVGVIWNRIADGHLRAVSIGYQVLRAVDIPPGDTQNVNGRSYTAGERTLRVTTDWRVHELSLTPIGADSAALIRSQQGIKPATKRSFFR